MRNAFLSLGVRHISMWAALYTDPSRRNSAKDCTSIYSKCAGDQNQFEHVDPALAGLIRGNKTLRLSQTAGQGLLGEAKALPCVGKALTN
jgi:hypothetical protein